MTDRKKTKVGTDSYFKELRSKTMFKDMIMKDSDNFDTFLITLGKNAASTINDIYNDINRSDSKVAKFSSISNNFDNIILLSANLYDLAKLTKSSASKSNKDIEKALEKLSLPRGVTLREVEGTAKDIKDNKLIKQSESYRIALVKKALSQGARAGKDGSEKAYIEYLLKFHKKEVLMEAIEYLELKGKSISNSSIAHPKYLENRIADVFGANFTRQNRSIVLDKNFSKNIQSQIANIIKTIRANLKSAYSSSEYMEYRERACVEKVITKLNTYVSGYAGDYKKEIAALRRLEDNNKIIKINRKGSQYSVEAELYWYGGKNVLRECRGNCVNGIISRKTVNTFTIA